MQYIQIRGYYSAIKRNGTDTCYQEDGPQKCYTKWKKTDTKNHILFDSIHMKLLKQWICRDEK